MNLSLNKISIILVVFFVYGCAANSTSTPYEWSNSRYKEKPSDNGGASRGVIQGLQAATLRNEHRSANRRAAFQRAELAAFQDDLANIQTINPDGSIRDIGLVNRDREILFLDIIASPNIDDNTRATLSSNFRDINNRTVLRGGKSKDVFVKYRKGTVNTDNFIEYSLKQSSLVKEIFYDTGNSYLLVRLKNTFYHYCGISQKTVSRWANADSLGKYYHRNVRGKFDCRTGYVPQY